MPTQQDLHHQAERCRRMQSRDDQRQAAKLLFAMLLESFQAKLPERDSKRWIQAQATGQ
jgi:hypothetical protein